MCKDRDVSSVGNMSRREMRLWRDVQEGGDVREV